MTFHDGAIQVFPKPIYVNQHPRFFGERCVQHSPDLDLRKLTFHDCGKNLEARLRLQLSITKFGYRGTYHGEIVIMDNGLLGIDEFGSALKLNADASEDRYHKSMFSMIEDMCFDESFFTMRAAYIQNWGKLPTVENAVFLMEAHAQKNYFHFHTGLLPRVRNLGDAKQLHIAISEDCLKKSYQRDLIVKAWDNRQIIPCPAGVKLKDPVLLYEPFSKGVVDWLRENVGPRLSSGDRRIYITRKALADTHRKHGQIFESEEFLGLLREFGFESVDFGTGEMPIEDQIRLLDRAGLVLGVHGANMTNIAYLPADCRVVELLPTYWADHSYMQLCASIGLHHDVIVCSEFGESLEIQVKLPTLRKVLTTLLRP
ncbi:glycosyltransferase family 61 protein [Methylobacterium sp. JK268]